MTFELKENELDVLLSYLPNSGIIILRGDLASGKTTLAKQIIKFYGYSDNVTSPTFSLMQNYGQIYHYDIYRCGVEGLLKNGLIENFFEDGLHIVEWGNEQLISLLKDYGLDCTLVDISVIQNARLYKVKNA